MKHSFCFGFIVFSLIAVAIGVGCSGGNNGPSVTPTSTTTPTTQPTANGGTLTSLFSGISGFDMSNNAYSGVVHSGVLPQGNEPAPVIEQEGGIPTITYVQNGAFSFPVFSEGRVEKIFVGVQGYSGYYEVNLATAALRSLRNSSDREFYGKNSFDPKNNVTTPSDWYTAFKRPKTIKGVSVRAVGANQYLVTVSVTSNAPLSPSALQVTVQSGGKTTKPASSPIKGVAQALTGLMQVSMSWNKSMDYDLHVVTPSGNDIYFNNTSAEGGNLNVDSWAGCSENTDRTVENVTWVSTYPEAGIYRVEPTVYSSCEAVGPYACNVTINTPIGTRSTATVVLGGEGSDPNKWLYFCVIHDQKTEQGLLDTLVFNEPSGIQQSNSVASIKIAMNAVRAGVVNRLNSPRDFPAIGRNPTLSSVIKSGDFQNLGLTGPKPYVNKIIGQGLSPSTGVSYQTVGAKLQDYQDYWKTGLDVASGQYTDPFDNVTVIDEKMVKGGTYFWQGCGNIPDASCNTGGAGTSRAIKIPRDQGGIVGGNQFFTLDK